jgi:hypothetical protein
LVTRLGGQATGPWRCGPARIQRQEPAAVSLAIPLYRHAADAGDWRAAVGLDELLVDCGDLDGLRARADADDWHAAELLTRLLADRGDPDGSIASA